MNITFKINQPESKAGFEWQLDQDINVFDGGKLIAKAELEILTLNKHRDAAKSYQALEELGATDWEIPLNLYFKNQNVTLELCERLTIKPESKKSAQHIMIEAISVLPEYRNKGIAKLLLAKIAQEYTKAQSIWLMAMPMQNFVDVAQCADGQDKAYYSALNLNEEQATSVSDFFLKAGFEQLTIDEALLVEALPYDLMIATPSLLTE